MLGIVDSSAVGGTHDAGLEIIDRYASRRWTAEYRTVRTSSDAPQNVANVKPHGMAWDVTRPPALPACHVRRKEIRVGESCIDDAVKITIVTNGKLFGTKSASRNL